MLARLFILLFISSILTVPAQAGEKGVLGALIGAGVGAGIGHATDRTGGSGKGAVIGAIGGYVIGDQIDKAETRNPQTREETYQRGSTGRSINSSRNCNEADALLNQANRSQDTLYKVYLLQKAARFCPNSAQMHNDLGVAYYQRNGQYDRQRASDEFNEAIRIDPDYDVARNNLARL